MKKFIYLSLILVSLLSCSDNDDDNNPVVNIPETYSFERNGSSTVSYGGQTTRIKMSQELINAMKNKELSKDKILAMFDHKEGANDFSDVSLNSSDKNIKSKTAASKDFFSDNTTTSNSIKADFETWITKQVEEVFPKWNDNAEAGKAGKIQESGGGSTRYVNSQGLELNQALNKSLIGALMVDQILNNYISKSVLDDGDNIKNNNDGKLDEGKNYTKMEHKWDEAFGYLYGAEEDAKAPKLNKDSFLNKYLDRVEKDEKHAGIAKRIYDAFKAGRAAIVAKNYDERDKQANVIRGEISKIIAVRAVYYLQAGKKAKQSNDLGSAFHDLSEGYGFIYSLQFTRIPNTETPYFNKGKVDGFINELMKGNGFWDVSVETLDKISKEIADKFGLQVDTV